jgi:tRNA (guanine37-N1)-methyltransferase
MVKRIKLTYNKPMQFDVLTLFPEMFKSPFSDSIIGRAIKNKKININLHQMRQWAWNSYKAVDDKPYGGGVGMLIRVDVIDKALKEIKSKIKNQKIKIILTSARGKRFTQEDAVRLSKEKNIIIICGHYEGFDERVSKLTDEEISIGDYVLTGGELPAMVMIDSITRLLPGVLGKDKSSQTDSFSRKNFIEYSQYTRPAEYKGEKVPEVLLSGDPTKIKEWQEEQAKNHENT